MFDWQNVEERLQKPQNRSPKQYLKAGLLRFVAQHKMFSLFTGLSSPVETLFLSIKTDKKNTALRGF